MSTLIDTPRPERAALLRRFFQQFPIHKRRFASSSGIMPATLYNALNGEAQIQDRTWEKICRELERYDFAG